jgi:putative phosphoribosyl transferase
MGTAAEQSQGPELTFANRQAAGATLATALMRFGDEDPLILGIPRGGVPVAAEVARRLGAELDVVIARKLGAPDQPELALGAVTATGGLYIDQDIVANHEVTEEHLAAIITRETEAARDREERFRGGRPQPRVAQRTVIIVDDGLATGATLRATLQVVRAQGAARLVAAVPVGPAEFHEVLQDDADEVICSFAPDSFESVSFYYDDFREVSDEDVQEILQEFTSDGGQRPATTPPPEANPQNAAPCGQA